MKIVAVLGTRPEIIKLSPLLPLLDQYFDNQVIHTGQHYSYDMDEIFFNDLKLKKPNYMLNVGSDTHSRQTAKMLMGIEDILINEAPDLVIVQGDTNSTLSGALAASKLLIPVAHVEAGCRSFDKKMPEEINRIVVDHLSEVLFAPDEVAHKNLIKEGIPKDLIYLVGNTSIDACLRIKDLYEKSDSEFFDVKKESHALLTIHRQENTIPHNLKGILEAINEISQQIKIIFPVHPRTRKVMNENDFKMGENVILIDPVGYKDFISILSNSKFVMTDSGGIQEESAVLDVPCFILRNKTEWQYLVDLGKNVIVGTKKAAIVKNIDAILKDDSIINKMRSIKVYDNSKASLNIISILKKIQL